MIYVLLAIGVLFIFALMPFEVGVQVAVTLLIETLAVMAAAYFIIGKVSFFSALKAVGLSIILSLVAAAFMLPALGGSGGLALPVTVIVTFAAAIWGISIGLKATFGQAALIGVIFTGVYWLASSLLGFGASLSGAV